MLFLAGFWRMTLFVLSCTGLVMPAYAANNVFMSAIGARGPIQGDPKSPHGSRWIPIVEFDEPVVASRDAATGQASERRQHQPVRIVKLVDAASPQLKRTAAAGEHLKEVVFQFYRSNAGKEELYETIRLSDAIISSVQNRGSSSAGSERPTEEISFQYAKIEITYARQEATPLTKSPVAVKPSNRLPH
jgi:type VI secretion system secreted protein Hcp